jgi:hypothetical protein
MVVILGPPPAGIIQKSDYATNSLDQQGIIPENTPGLGFSILMWLNSETNRELDKFY